MNKLKTDSSCFRVQRKSFKTTTQPYLYRGYKTMISSWRGIPRQFFSTLLIAGFSQMGYATHLDSVTQAQQQIHKKANRSQQHVEKLDDQTQVMLAEFREASLELKNLKAYHDQLAKIVKSQEQEKVELKEQMLEIEITQRNIMPLMLRMQKVLEQFVELDAPFLEKERKLRISSLHKMMDRSDVDLAEKYRRLIEAYMIETDYGRTIESYTGRLELEDKQNTVDFLRFGRLGLYYLSLDGNQAGYWMRKEKRWETLPDSYRSSILQGLRIAKKQAAPDLLKLPVSAPEAIQ